MCVFAIAWTLARQAPLSTGFSRQEYWSGLSFPAPGDLPVSGIEPVSPVSPILAGRFFTTAPPFYSSTITYAFSFLLRYNLHFKIILKFTF